jgi:erythromycin esterase
MPDAAAADGRADLVEWIAREAISFSLDAPEAFHAAVDRMLAAIGGSVDLLGLGEPMHGGEDFLVLRNRLFERLVTAHGYTAIAVESSFPRGLLVDAYVAGRGAGGASGAADAGGVGGGTDREPVPASYEAVRDAGFSHGFGKLDANRELVEWMRLYNADPAHAVKLRFYGFDSPTEMMASDSPRRVLHVGVDHLAAVDPAAARAWRERLDPLIGDDAAWENPAANMDPTQSVGRSPAADALRVATEDLIAEVATRRPDLVAATDAGRHAEAAHHLVVARQLLAYHAAVATPSDRRLPLLLGIRDAMMADTLAYAVARERGRGGGGGRAGGVDGGDATGRPGKVLAFAHNSHLKRGVARWQLGPHALAWWPAGAHLAEMLGPRYAVIGTGVGTSADNGVGTPEPGTLEARLTAAPGPGQFVPTHGGRGPLAAAAEAATTAEALPTRSGAARNPTYFPLTADSLTDFDWLAVLDATGYARGGPHAAAAAEPAT